MLRLLSALCALSAVLALVPMAYAAPGESYVRDPVVLIDHGIICQVRSEEHTSELQSHS